MKSWILLNCFNALSVFLNCAKINHNKFDVHSRKSSNLIDATHEAINGVLVTNFAKTNIIFPTKAQSYESRDFRNDLLAAIFATPKIGLHLEVTGLNSTNARRKFFMIYLIESFDDFMEIYVKMDMRILRFNGLYLVVLVNGEISEIQEIFKHLWKLKIFNVNLISEDRNGTIYVKTFNQFSNGNCNDTTPIVINQFKDEAFINGIENFFPKKMFKLHGCQIRVSVSNDSEPFIVAQRLPNGNYHLSGRDVKLINTIADSLNFKINYTFIGNEGIIYENGSADGHVRVLLDGGSDLGLSNFWLKGYRLKFFDATSSYIGEKIIFVIPPGSELTKFEKLIYPFSPAVWSMVLMCFMIGCFVIFLINRRSKVIRNFVFGTGIPNPYWNVLIGFIGESQPSLPRRNFARYLLMMFLLYSLVMRTLYQASYFDLLQSNRNHKEVETINEMLEQNFKFYVYTGNADLFQATPAIKKRFVVVQQRSQMIMKIL